MCVACTEYVCGACWLHLHMICACTYVYTQGRLRHLSKTEQSNVNQIERVKINKLLRVGF